MSKGKPNTSRMTLRKYLDDVYIPAKREAGVPLCERTCTYYRGAIRQLEQCMGRQIRCVEVTEEMLHRLFVWMIERGLTHKTAKSTTCDLKGIIRHWNPERFPRAHGAFKPMFVDADITETLDYVLVNRYFAEKPSIASPSTVRHYGRCVRLFGEFLERPATASDLTDNTVGRFLRWLVETRRLKAVSANGYVKQIKALWTWMARRRLVAEFPTIEQLREPHNPPIAWTRDELKRLMNACSSAAGKMGRVPAAKFWVAFHHVLWDTGERTGALFALRWEWLDFKTGYLSVPAEIRKGGQTSMVYALKPATVEALEAIRSPRRELIFERKPFRNNFYDHYRRLVLSAGLEYVKGKTGPQRMRRSFASHIEAAGGNATRALKHSDRRVTDESYLDPRIADTHAENQKLFPLDGGEAD